MSATSFLLRLVNHDDLLLVLDNNRRYRQEALKLRRHTCRPGTQLTSAESCGSNIACCCADVGGYE